MEEILKRPFERWELLAAKYDFITCRRPETLEAKLGTEQFEDEDGGTYQIDLQAVELLIQEARAGQLIEKTNLEGVEQLYKLGYLRSRNGTGRKGDASWPCN